MEAEKALIGAAERYMRTHELAPEMLYFMHRCGRANPGGEFGEMLAQYRPAGEAGEAIWQEPAPPSLLIDEVERIWDAISAHDDWSALHAKVAAIRELGQALGEPPSAP